MEDTWQALQEVKKRTMNMKERLAKRKKERAGLLNACEGTSAPDAATTTVGTGPVVYDPHIEAVLLQCLVDAVLALPVDSHTICASVSAALRKPVPHTAIVNLLQKFHAQNLICIEESSSDGNVSINITHTDDSKILAVTNESSLKLPQHPDDDDTDAEKTTSTSADINNLLSMPSSKEREIKKVGDEIMELLSKPTVREKSIAERFRSQGGAQVQEFCPQGTKDECNKVQEGALCDKLHFRKIIQTHTDESLGDCSFLNTCFHMDTCKFVHYEVDYSSSPAAQTEVVDVVEAARQNRFNDRSILFKPQWIQCDLRYFDMSVLGKFSVVMADPPWDIHMELPYGTMADDEMLNLGIPCLQEDGCIFLWVTGRAMELGRECLSYWGYDRVDEIIWVKTNQLQRIIRTGRTGHWINHGKEHCLVGMKGSPKLNRGLDCDVIVAEVRATSHKPDEIYGIIERLSPGTRKIELFGRQHNVQPNWITLGNQVDGIHLLESELITRFNKRYPDGNCMINQKSTVK